MDVDEEAEEPRQPEHGGQDDNSSKGRPTVEWQWNYCLFKISIVASVNIGL